MKRVVISGTTGSGKSTLAARLAEELDATFIDIDELHWGPDWTPRPTFREDLDRATLGHQWVAAGNYSSTRDLTWGRADTIVWLDYPALLVFARLLRRTLRRLWTRERLFSGNVETFRNTFLSRDSLLVWFFKTHWSKRGRYEEEFRRLAQNGTDLVRLRHPRDAERWIGAIREI